MLQLKLIEKLAEKQKWMTRYCGSYNGPLRPMCEDVFGPTCRFYVAIDGDKELGFMRIASEGHIEYARGTLQAAALMDAYVKPPYRRQGVLREMITQAVRDLNVRLLVITEKRFHSNRGYYYELGFTVHQAGSEDGLTWLLETGLARMLEASNDAHYRKSA